MERKILFLDLDGTLLNDEKELTEGNRRAIEKAVAAGHRVVLTSGRPLEGTLTQAKLLGLDGEGCYVIAYNGGLVYDCGQKKELSRKSIPPETLYAIFHEANRRGVHIQTYGGGKVVVERRNDNENVRRYCGLIQMQFQVVGDIQGALPVPPVKALMIDFQGREKTGAMQAWVLREKGDAVDCYFSSEYFLEVVPAGVNKGAAVEAFCQMCGVPLECAVAVGDEANDISMIRAAGVGVAMRNAKPEVKAAADYITERDNNHDGIQEVIERFLKA